MLKEKDSLKKAGITEQELVYLLWIWNVCCSVRFVQCHDKWKIWLSERNYLKMYSLTLLAHIARPGIMTIGSVDDIGNKIK